eukprot:Skav229240  [mRNA]  locus=scaffold2154:137098:138506:+ [translate_table: standard]
MGLSGQVAPSRLEAIDVIQDFWAKVWDNQVRSSPSSEEIAAALTDAVPPEVRAQSISWTWPTKGQLLNACAPSGAARPDGWSAEEIRQLPAAAVSLYHKLTLRWLATGAVPQALCQVLEVNLPQESKVEQRSVDVARASHIHRKHRVVQFRAKLALNDLRAGMGLQVPTPRRAVPDSRYLAHRVRGRTLQSRLVESLRSNSAGGREHHSAESRLARPQTQQDLLGRRNRSSPAQSHHGNPSRMPCLTAALGNYAGAPYTSGNPNIVQKVYMDDRSFWGRSKEDIDQQIVKRQQFSFEEDEKKLQLTSDGREIKFLGVVAVRRPRVNRPEEEARLRKAMLRADLLR